MELGQELDLSLGQLSALLDIVRCAISMCTRECRARRGWAGHSTAKVLLSADCPNPRDAPA